MLRDGLRWVPEAASDLLDAEFAAVEKMAREALLAATGGKSADDFIAGRLDKIAADCKRMAVTIAPDRKPPPDLVERIKEDLTKRLRRNLDHGVTPGINRSQMQISLQEGHREGPWDLVVTFLASTASMPREIITDKVRMRGLVSSPEAMIRAFDLFDDPLVGRHLARRRVDDEAKQELSVIKHIMEHPTASPKHRAYALFNLIKGLLIDAEAALTEELTPS
jgi:hypothetical protein